MKGVVYQGVRLMPGSDALALYEAHASAKPPEKAKAKKALDDHMVELDRVWKKLEGR